MCTVHHCIPDAQKMDGSIDKTPSAAPTTHVRTCTQYIQSFADQDNFMPRQEYSGY